MGAVGRLSVVPFGQCCRRRCHAHFTRFLFFFLVLFLSFFLFIFLFFFSFLFFLSFSPVITWSCVFSLYSSRFIFELRCHVTMHWIFLFLFNDHLSKGVGCSGLQCSAVDTLEQASTWASKFCTRAPPRCFLFVLLAPSPTLSPTDPVPRGLLTLWAGLHVCVCVCARAHTHAHVFPENDTRAP